MKCILNYQFIQFAQHYLKYNVEALTLQNLMTLLGRDIQHHVLSIPYSHIISPKQEVHQYLI